MPNHIVIELCAEDRARLDKLQTTLDALAKGNYTIVTDNIRNVDEALLRGSIGNAGHPGDMGPVGVAGAAAPAESDPEQMSIPEVIEPETPPASEAAPEPEEVKVSVVDVQRLVVSLSQAGKKTEVRDIVKAYADKVSTIPEDKLAEVWKKLSALGG